MRFGKSAYLIELTSSENSFIGSEYSIPLICLISIKDYHRMVAFWVFIAWMFWPTEDSKSIISSAQAIVDADTIVFTRMGQFSVEFVKMEFKQRTFWSRKSPYAPCIFRIFAIFTNWCLNGSFGAVILYPLITIWFSRWMMRNCWDARCLKNNK